MSIYKSIFILELHGAPFVVNPLGIQINLLSLFGGFAVFEMFQASIYSNVRLISLMVVTP